jgi:transketolase
LETVKKLQLELLAAQIRKESILSMGSYGSGHVGGVLSIADLIAVLYGGVMRYDPKNPNKEDRDRLVLSKGHCGPVLYAALALSGFFPLEWLSTLNADGTRLPSHCNMHDTPGIDIGTGSLGQGASLALGMALGMKIRRVSECRVYLVLGDGECDEGQVWEAALLASQKKLDNLIAFVDLNHQQLDGYTDDIVALGDLARKFAEFGWRSRQVNGHDVEAIHDAVMEAQSAKDAPSIVILDTVKGKGWSATEGKSGVHHMAISEEQLKTAQRELEGRIEELRKNIEQRLSASQSL